MTSIHVVAGILRAGDKILCARRAEHKDLAGHWEFPGGKVENAETPTAALKRELAEELGLVVEVGAKYGHTQTKSGSRHIHLDFFDVHLEATIEIASSDHDKLEWRTCAQLLELNWAPADIPIVEQLARGL